MNSSGVIIGNNTTRDVVSYVFEPDATPWQIICHFSVGLLVPAGPSLWRCRRRCRNSCRMSDQYKTTDVIQGKVLAALPWVGGRKTEAVARHAALERHRASRAGGSAQARHGDSRPSELLAEKASGLMPVR